MVSVLNVLWCVRKESPNVTLMDVKAKPPMGGGGEGGLLRQRHPWGRGPARAGHPCGEGRS